jgi:hypothetical protein
MSDITVERVDRADGHQQWVVKVAAGRTWPGYPIELPLEDFREGALIETREGDTISPLFTLDALRPEWV